MSSPCDFQKVCFSIFNFIFHKCQTDHCFITGETLKVVLFLLADMIWFWANTNFIFAKFKRETI